MNDNNEDNDDRFAAVILCAGSSSRMGGIKKEYQKLSGDIEQLTVLGASVSVFAQIPEIKTIVLAVRENEETAARSALPAVFKEQPNIFFVTGGETRRSSVYNALSFLAPHKPGYVLIHDGARPWISVSLVNNLIAAVKKYKAVIPLIPLTDTPKECSVPFPAVSVENTAACEQAVFISRHLNRMNTGAAQTPQVFEFSGIFEAHKKAAAIREVSFTDDAEIWSRFCGQVAAIPGDVKNRKITFKEDL